MLEPRPPRQEPRLLVVEVDQRAVRVVALDAWEIRCLDTLPKNLRALSFALWRVVVQARPSHILLSQRLSHGWHGRSLVARLAVKKGLPFAAVDRDESASLAKAAPDYDELLRAYPEAAHLVSGPRDPTFRPFRIAVGVLLTRSLPPRRYVSRQPPGTTSCVAR